jgi:glutathione synthase/RimK-type ligase-like ATP-grasp enzyme
MDNIHSVMVIKNNRLHSNTLRINQEVYSELNLRDDEPVAICAGRLCYRQKISIVDKPGRNIELNPAILRKIHLITPRKYGLTDINNHIRIGPVVGIMADTTGDMKRPFAGQSKFFREVISAAEELGEICFGFGPEGINYHNGTILGYIYTNGAWKRIMFPIPDVVYPRDGGYSYRSLQIRKRLEDLGCKFINPPLIGKWETYKALSRNVSIDQYIPDTRRVNSSYQIEQMLLRYGAVYLKPVTGSQGKYIIKVSRIRHTKTYKYQYQVNYQAHEGTANGLSNLHHILKRLMNDRSYIVQRRIKLLKVGGKIADVRVLVQKDDTGQWSVTGKAVRIGKRGSITSNISGGGSGQRLPVVLSQHFLDPLTRDRIVSEINYLAIESAKELEASIADIGELGIDIGIDTNGRVWFIEANLKPARHVFVLIGELSTRKMAVVKPLLYSRYLANFSQEV